MIYAASRTASGVGPSGGQLPERQDAHAVEPGLFGIVAEQELHAAGAAQPAQPFRRKALVRRQENRAAFQDRELEDKKRFAALQPDRGYVSGTDPEGGKPIRGGVDPVQQLLEGQPSVPRDKCGPKRQMLRRLPERRVKAVLRDGRCRSLGVSAQEGGRVRYQTQPR